LKFGQAPATLPALPLPKVTVNRGPMRMIVDRYIVAPLPPCNQHAASAVQPTQRKEQVNVEP
jgi:hypothetical protein